MKSITVKLDSKSVTVSKLPLGKYAELLDALEELPKNLSGLDGLENEQMFSMLPKLIAKSLPDFISIIHIATGLPKAEIEQLGLDEVVDIVKAIIEVNNYSKIFSEIKKVMGQKSPKEIGSGI